MLHKTLIIDIKRNALDDGPGIRTLIFFKGCPLSCAWCQNPEAKNPLREIAFERADCIECKQCLDVCEQNAIIFSKNYRINRSLCDLCGKCIEICPNRAISYVGKEYKVEDLLKIILKDKIFYDNSGGGVTFSGGEPLYHMDYLHKLLKELKEKGVHTCIETCGYYDELKFDQLILPYIDLIYFDLKIFNPKLHFQYCKAKNQRILKNFKNLLKKERIKVLPRIPLIPNITTTKKNLGNWKKYLKSLNIKQIGLIPYNPLYLSKYDKLGMKPSYNHSNWLTEDQKKTIKELLFEFEFRDF